MLNQLCEVELSGLPSFYDDAGLMELKDETFIFGVNGTGKSSIARKLKQQAVANGLSVALFDQRYIRDLIQQESIEGVFQIRDASEEVQKRLKELSGEQGAITRKRKYIEELERTQKEKNDITDKIKEEFEKNAWNIKRDCIAKYPEATALCFKRLNTREKFQKECLDRYKSMKNVDYEEPSDLEFEERAKSIKMDNPRIDAICSENVFNFQLSEEEKSVAQTQYRLCKDNPLSDLISQMNIDQWVKEGIQHLNNSESDVCPLCQQSLSDELKNNLEQLVNQDFDAAEKCLDSLTERLKKSERGCEEISKELGKLARFDTTELEKSLNKLRLEFKDLRDNVNEKKRNLQKSIVLAFNTDIRDECKDALYSLNKKLPVITKPSRIEKRLSIPSWTISGRL